MKEILKKTADELPGVSDSAKKLGWSSAVSAMTAIGIFGMVGAYAFTKGGRRSGKRLLKNAVETLTEQRPAKKLKKPAMKKTLKKKLSKSRGAGANA